jgi:DNA-binding transcriptional LysR family regulator
MNTEKISALLLTIEKGSISAAAEQINYTPSAVSRCIQSLEKEIGLPLLKRSKSGVEVTEACRNLLPDFRRVIQDESLMREHASQIAEGLSGTIRLGICYPAFYPWLSAVMADFKTYYPDVHYIVNHGFSTVLMDQVISCEIDLCLISRRDDSYGWVPLLDDDLVAILPAEHPLAGADSVPLSIYEDAPYLELHSYKDTDNTRTLDAAGVHPRSIIHLGDSSALYPMVEAGLGIGMENRINTLRHEGSFVVKPFCPPQVIPLGIAYRDDVLPVTRKFIDHLAASKDSFLDRII